MLTFKIFSVIAVNGQQNTIFKYGCKFNPNNTEKG
jgi:hypothetical protein